MRPSVPVRFAIPEKLPGCGSIACRIVHFRAVDGVQPIAGDELRQLRALKKSAESPFVFETECGGAMSTRNVRAIVARAAEESGLTLDVHAHMLRHSCGYNLATSVRAKDSQAFAFLNDTHDVPGTVIEALEKYGLTPVMWSQRERVKDKLAA